MVYVVIFRGSVTLPLIKIMLIDAHILVIEQDGLHKDHRFRFSDVIKADKEESDQPAWLGIFISLLEKENSPRHAF